MSNSLSSNFSVLYSGVVLFPEATLPLRVLETNFIAAVERALNQVDAPYTVGVVGKLCKELVLDSSVYGISFSTFAMF